MGEKIHPLIPADWPLGHRATVKGVIDFCQILSGYQISTNKLDSRDQYNLHAIIDQTNDLCDK